MRKREQLVERSCNLCNSLLNGLAFLAHDAFVAVAHALAFVRFRRIEAANLGGNLSYDLPIRAFDGKFGVLLDCHFDLFGNIVNNRMRVSKAEVDGFTRNCGFKANALNLELLNKTFTYTPDHVVDQGAAEAVQRFGLSVISLTADDHVALINFQSGAVGQFPVELAFGAFDRDLLAFDFHFYFGWNDNRLFSNAGHNLKIGLMD